MNAIDNANSTIKICFDLIHITTNFPDDLEESGWVCFIPAALQTTENINQFTEHAIYFIFKAIPGYVAVIQDRITTWEVLGQATRLGNNDLDCLDSR